MTLDKKNLYQVPVASTDFVADAYYEQGHPTAIRYYYRRDGANYRSGIQFTRVRSTRTRAESSCTAWHVEGAYDTLVEVVNSTWVQELQLETSETQASMGEHWKMHHYMLYLDSVGCFEIIAETWEALPEENGLWPAA